jgi:hypothetical protein
MERRVAFRRREAVLRHQPSRLRCRWRIKGLRAAGAQG